MTAETNSNDVTNYRHNHGFSYPMHVDQSPRARSLPTKKKIRAPTTSSFGMMDLFKVNNRGHGVMSKTATYSSTLAVFAATWGTVAATSYGIRLYRRYKQRNYEERIVKQGGLLPQTSNVIQALEYRGTDPKCCNSLALEDSNGKKYTWKEYHDEVHAFARALLQQQAKGGPTHGVHGIAVHAFNRPEWFIAAMGAISAGYTVSGIYLTNTYEQAKHIIQTSDVTVLVLEGIDLLETTYKTVLEEFPQLTVVLLDGNNDQEVVDRKSDTSTSRVVSYAAFVESTRRDGPNSAKNGTLPLVPLSNHQPACLVYTSGTTGSPKAVELTLDNIHFVNASMHARIPLTTKDRFVSFLPLSHVAAMCIDIFSPVYCGGSVHFADADALRGTLKDTLLRVRPTLFFGVPRVWEKMATAFQTAAQKSYEKPISGSILKTIGTLAKSVSRTWYNSDTPELVRSLLVIPFGLFKGLAYRKVRRACGLDKAKFLYTGAAPLSASTMTYLRSLDMPVLEVFGMSETSGVIAVCGPNDAIRPVGACGKCLPRSKVIIAESDGEILFQGENSMRSYKGLIEATNKTIDPKTKLLHTGDLGVIDKNGYLYITGRKKDLVITAGGENVAPLPIEEVIATLLKQLQQEEENSVGAVTVGHVMLIGDQRKFLTILIAPNEEVVAASQNNPQDHEQSQVHIKADHVEQAIATYNASYAKSRAQRIQKAHIVSSAFTVATGELTPTMKLKRNVVLAKYSGEIDAMYSDPSSKLVGYSSWNIDSPEAS